MKRLFPFFCSLLLLLALGLPVAWAAQPDTVSVQFHDETAGRYESAVQAEKVNVKLNGEPMELDVPAVTRTVDGVDGRTLVPVRPIAEALGATVLWMGENRQVVISAGEDMVILTLGSSQAVVNGNVVDLPGKVPAMVAKYDGVERTLVPLRFVSEQLHAQVDWDNDTFTALVTARQSQPEPEPTPSKPPAGPPDGFLLRVTADDNAQSITLYLNKAPRYQVLDLGDRVVIDLLGFAIGSGQDGSIRPENPVVDRVRYAQHGDDILPEENHVTRVVLDLAKGCSYEENVTVTGDANLQAVVVTVKPPATGPVVPTLPENWDPNAYTVVLDAGHGGSASGAVYEEIMEKDITLPITLRAAELLREKGYNVVLTRSTDVYMDLYDRCEIANSVEADAFVSIHANASSSNLSFQGTFTYSYPDSTRGEKLADCIQKAVVSRTGSIDRGLLTNDYVVLRETTMPAALLETGFMSCHEELMQLIRPDYQEKLAQGVAAGVESYLATLPQK
ncbi:MAG: AMIN domain-containing protein [Oscillospiraceae bacterium]|nr:AMIN domain-containing protein [Oscillospiraceae bacterium]